MGVFLLNLTDDWKRWIVFLVQDDEDRIIRVILLTKTREAIREHGVGAAHRKQHHGVRPDFIRGIFDGWTQGEMPGQSQRPESLPAPSQQNQQQGEQASRG